MSVANTLRVWQHPEGLRESFIFGGLQPLVKSPDEVYRRLYRKVIQRKSRRVVQSLNVRVGLSFLKASSFTVRPRWLIKA